MREAWLQHERHQHAVGQGGFHSAEVRSKADSFWYIYDCGSSNKDALQRELGAFSETHGTRTLDLLALSHLDDDHINGVEAILSERDVRNVMIPYLCAEERLLLIADDCARGALTESRLDMLEDPVAWFRSRGTRNVVQVLPAIGDGPDTGLNEAPPQSPEPTGPFDIKCGRISTQSERATYPDLDSDAYVLSSGDALSVSAQGNGYASMRYWELVPFCHPQLDGVHAFYSVVKKRFGLSPSARGKAFVKKLRRILVKKAKRAELKELYGKIWSDHNLSSMSLYSGPCFDWEDIGWKAQPGRHISARPVFDVIDGLRLPYRLKPGWLGTGDAKLIARTRYTQFEAYYRRVFPKVGSFLLPHHGSKYNFSGHLFRETLQPHVWCAAAGKNSYGHPDKNLRRALQRRGSYVRVSHVEGQSLSEYLRWF
jgi:hypothetical protein